MEKELKSLQLFLRTQVEELDLRMKNMKHTLKNIEYYVLIQLPPIARFSFPILNPN